MVVPPNKRKAKQRQEKCTWFLCLGGKKTFLAVIIITICNLFYDTTTTSISSSKILELTAAWNSVGESSKKNPSVSYSMQRWNNYNFTFCQANRCPVGVTTNKWGRHPYWRDPLLEQLQPLLNFTTQIVAKNMNILCMGDSVMMQLGQLLEEAAGALPETREVIHESWAFNEGVTISHTRDGSCMANYRITGMFLAKGEGEPLPNAFGGGWNKSLVEALRKHPLLGQPPKSTTTGTIVNGNNIHQNDKSKQQQQPGAAAFDVLIFRLPHGWLTFDDMNEDTIRETIQLAHDLFGIRQVIFIDIPFTNNVKTLQDLEDRKNTNEVLEKVAASYTDNNQQKGNSQIKQVSVLQFAKWTDHLMEYNARAIGVIPPELQHTVITNKSYALNRLGCRPKFPISIAQGCANLVEPGSCTCRRNRVAEDGMHWCLETVGGRFVAGIACLLSCMTKNEEDSKDCEAQCNKLYMSLRPLDFKDGDIF